MSGRVEITTVPKPWGHETIWARTDRYVGKILHIKAGHALSVQYHDVKDETVYLLRGEMRYWVGEGRGQRAEGRAGSSQSRPLATGETPAAGRDPIPEMTDVHLRVGDAFRITPHTVHYMEAVTDCDVLEVSTPELDDVVRLKDRYGREGDERAMKVIIPLAGKGTRLRPHTHITPKPMLKVAGKPVMAYILEDLERLGTVEQVIYITGHLKEKVEKYTRANFRIPAVFIEQLVQDGTAGAVNLAKQYVDQPVLIIFVDTIFDADLSIIDRTDADGIIWTKEVEDYQRFGVVVTDADGNMTKIVEKPKQPISKRANIGLYYIRNWKLLYEGIEYVLGQPKNMGEYFLTDAFQYMIERGAKIKVIDVDGWYDAGKIDTLLETNRVMLEKGRARVPEGIDLSQVVQPVYIEDGVTIASSIVGPNVSLGAGSIVENATLRDTIVGAKSRIVRSNLANSLIGDDVFVAGIVGEVTLGDHSEVRQDEE